MFNQPLDDMDYLLLAIKMGSIVAVILTLIYYLSNYLSLEVIEGIKKWYLNI